MNLRSVILYGADQSLKQQLDHKRCSLRNVSHQKWNTSRWMIQIMEVPTALLYILYASENLFLKGHTAIRVSYIYT